MAQFGHNLYNYGKSKSVIYAAKKTAIITHEQWVINMLEKSPTQHNIKSLVSSVYVDLFNQNNNTLKPTIEEVLNRPTFSGIQNNNTLKPARLIKNCPTKGVGQFFF